MLDIKLIRKEPDFFSKKLNNRNTKIDLKTLLDLYKYAVNIIKPPERQRIP